MKWLNFKLQLFFTICCLWGISASVFSQNEYEERIDHYKSQWEKLMPQYTKIQFAGGMGVMSFGTGWHYGSKNQWETDVFLGFLPKFQGDNFRFTFTIKQNFIPWNIPLDERYSFEPFSCGLYANSILDGDYWTSEPDKYPNNYYSFSTKVRFNLCVGQRWTFHIPEDKRKMRQSVTLYYEIGTCELYLISAIRGGYLKPKDYLKLSIGIKLQVL